MSMADFIGANKKQCQSEWGVQGYYVPNNSWFHHRPRTFVSKGKKENIIEWIAKKKKDLPAPNAYKLDSDWTKNPKGKFLKSRRITEID